MTATAVSLLPDCDVLWHVLKRCTAEMIAAAPKLRLIQKIGVGVNTIDLDAARARGIPVCNLPGTNSRAVAELTLALMLAVLRRVPRFDRVAYGRRLDRPGVAGRIGELGGRIVGLVGLRLGAAHSGADPGGDGLSMCSTPPARRCLTRRPFGPLTGCWRKRTSSACICR